MIRRAAPFIALLVLTALPAWADADPLRLQLFSEVDRRAVEVGGEVALTVEALASPASAEARRALLDALADLGGADAWGDGVARTGATEPAYTWDGRVLRWERRFRLRVTDEAVRAIPALRLRVEVGPRTVEFQTRPQPVEPFRADAVVDSMHRFVVPVTAEVEIDGVRFERIGSAFLVGGDALVTAYHVIVGAQRVRVRLPNGREVATRRVWGVDPTGDVAVLHLDADEAHEGGLRSLAVAPSPAAGSVAFTAGWPGGVQRRTAAVRYEDLVLGTRRLRLTANAVQPGDSGGPLLDERGRVLGVVVSGRSAGGDPDLLGESVCVAADPSRALVLYETVPRPIALSKALHAAARRLPSAQAHAAVGGLDVSTDPNAVDRRPHVLALLDALRRAPRDAALYYLAGTALEDAGEMTLAVGALDAAWRAGYVPAGYSLGHHLLRNGHLEAAAGVFEALAEGGAYARLGAFGQAQALVALGRPAAAARALEIVLDHDADFAPALYLLGLVRIGEGRAEEARALALRLADRPEWAAALWASMQAQTPEVGELAQLPRVALR